MTNNETNWMNGLNSVHKAIRWRRAMTLVADTPSHNPFYWT